MRALKSIGLIILLILWIVSLANIFDVMLFGAKVSTRIVDGIINS